MEREDADKWDARYREREDLETEPIPFLVDQSGRLASGKALVLAAGCGRNAVYLAERGFAVTALDISEVGLECCRKLADQRGVEVETICADLDNHDLGIDRYDLITMIYFNEPTLFPAIRRALNPGGTFFFHTFGQRHAEVGTFGPRNPAYLASQDTLRDAFSTDDIVICEEAVLTDEEDTESVLQAIIRIK